MIQLILAALFFTGIHLFISGTGLRGVIVDVTGERIYRGLFSLLSIAGLLWLIWAYKRAEYLGLWGPIHAFKPGTLILMMFAFLFAVLGLTTPNPTAVGGESLLEDPEPAKGILRITRHPFLWGVAIWAIAHLIVNGDAGSFIFFGSFLILVLAGTVSIDAKRKRVFGDQWERFASVTSNLPFMAILQGHNVLRLGELGGWRIMAALLAYALVLSAHPWLFGVSPW